MPPSGSQTRHIKINVVSSGDPAIRQMAASMGQLNKSSQSLYQRFKLLSNSIIGFSVAGLGIQTIVSFSDTMQNLNNRIASLTGSQEAATKTMAGLLKVANDTNTSIDSVAESYARLSISLKNTGASSAVMLDIVKVLQNSFRLSGSTITETTATIVQLGQAFASGQLRGQELRSVMEQNAEIAILLRKEFGKDIYKKAADGAISAADVMRVLFKNMDTINERAKALAPTIGQTLTKALNTFKVGLNDLNKNFNIAGNFAKAVDFFIERLPILGAALVVLAAVQLPALTVSLHRAAAAMLAFSLSNPVTAILVGLTTAVFLLTNNMDELRKSVLKLDYWILIFAANMQEADAAITRWQAKIPGFGYLKKNVKEFEDNAKRLRGIAEEIKQDVLSVNKGVEGPEDNGAKEREEYLKRLEAQFAKTGKAEKFKDILGRINREFLAGRLSASDYAHELDEFNLFKLNGEFAQGKFNLEAYNEGMEKITRSMATREFNAGRISFEKFNQAIQASKIKDLNGDLKSGKINLVEYNMELTKISDKFQPGGALITGVQGYLQSVGTTSSQVAGAIQNVFTSLETRMFEFIKTGKASFREFTIAILDDLTKIIIRASIIKPLADGILGFMTPTADSGTAMSGYNTTPGSVMAAKGRAFDKGMKKFATGGVVSSPTMFGYGRGKTGVMGEAGPEAILPLSRGKGGNLGVQATVTPVNINIVNQSASEIQQKETTGPNGERTIEILIVNKVKEGMASGSFDKIMQSSYGLRRRGS